MMITIVVVVVVDDVAGVVMVDHRWCPYDLTGQGTDRQLDRQTRPFGVRKRQTIPMKAIYSIVID